MIKMGGTGQPASDLICISVHFGMNRYLINVVSYMVLMVVFMVNAISEWQLIGRLVKLTGEMIS